MNLTDVIIGVVIIGGAFWLYNKNSGVRDFLTLGQSTSKAPNDKSPDVIAGKECGYGGFPPCADGGSSRRARLRITMS